MSGDTRHAELMAGTAKHWCARSVAAAFERAGVECPISGDALRLELVPYRAAFYERHRAIEDRELSAASGMLW